MCCHCGDCVLLVVVQTEVNGQNNRTQRCGECVTAHTALWLDKTVSSKGNMDAQNLCIVWDGAELHSCEALPHAVFCS